MKRKIENYLNSKDKNEYSNLDNNFLMSPLKYNSKILSKLLYSFLSLEFK